MIWLLAVLVLPPFLMLSVYVLWIQHERGGLWKACWLFAVPGGPMDVFLAHTLFAAYVWDYPKAGEWTFSQQLGRLVKEDGKRGGLARYIARVLNAIAPSGLHIYIPKP